MRTMAPLSVVLLVSLSDVLVRTALERARSRTNGPNGADRPVTGTSTARPGPERLTEESLELVWRVEELGPSYASPVVTKTHVFTVETEDEEREVVRALDRATGSETWTTNWEGAMEVPFFAARNGSWIRSSPALDGESLYVAGIRDVLVCLNVENGQERWRVDFTERFDTKVPDFGYVSSPLVKGAHVFVQAASSLIKLDKETGETEWRVLADSGMNSPFSSPTLAKLGGREQLLVLSRTHLSGGRAGDGRRPVVDADRSLPRHEHPHSGDLRRRSLHGGLRRSRAAPAGERRRGSLGDEPSLGAPRPGTHDLAGRDR